MEIYLYNNCSGCNVTDGENKGRSQAALLLLTKVCLKQTDK